MASPPLFDLSQIDLNQVQYDAAALEAVNPHRGDMRLLDGVIWASPDESQAVAYKDITDEQFWVPGHIPGRPLLPGVLMIEAAAQLASFITLSQLGKPNTFMGFVGVDDVKFRGQVVPGDRLLVVAELVEKRRRRSICRAQAWVGDTLVFEGLITGMMM